MIYRAHSCSELYVTNNGAVKDWLSKCIFVHLVFLSVIKHTADEQLLLLLLLLSASVVSDSVRPHRRQPTRLPVPGILQARTLEWVTISFSNAWKWKVKVKSLSCVRLLATPWTAAHQALPSMGFSRQEYWSGVPLPSLELLLGVFKNF